MHKIGNKRKSGIELLKIIAIFLIVESHTLEDLWNGSIHLPKADRLYFNHASADIQNVVLSIVNGSGPLGVLIFFTCTAWFLLNFKKRNKDKVFYLIADVWVISIIFLIGFELWGGIAISQDYFMKSIFPTFYSNNWYITWYILFYLAHEKINQIIYGCTKRQLFSCASFMFILLFVLAYLGVNLDYGRGLILFVGLYFIIAYIKLYMPKFCENIKANVILFFTALLLMIAVAFIADYLGLTYGFSANNILRWTKTNFNPFLLVMAISLFNVFRSKYFVNGVINKIASFSLIVYVIYENLIFSRCVRPMVWTWIHNTYGYDHVLLYSLIFSAVGFTVCCLLAFIYQTILQKIVHKAGKKLGDGLLFVCNKAAVSFMKIG